MKNFTLIEENIELLIQKFLENPRNFFHEKDLHSVFFNLCSGKLGTARPNDAIYSIDLFRQEYNTIGRYKRKDTGGIAFDKSYNNEGYPGSIDFVLLNEDFVKNHNFLEVLNKDESRRALIRNFEDKNSKIDIGIEFKMAHCTKKDFINIGEVNTLKKGLLEDCRKLALERIPIVYLIAFSHGILPQGKEAEKIINECTLEYLKYKGIGKISIFIITPQFKFVKLLEGSIKHTEFSSSDVSNSSLLISKESGKAWYYSKGDMEDFYFAFVNSRGSCSFRGFTKKDGKCFIGPIINKGDFHDNFRNYLKKSIHLVGLKKINLVNACKNGLSKSQLEELNKQIISK